MIRGLVLDHGCQSEEKYHRKSFLELAVQGLQDYFKKHSFARNYILDLCKSNFPKHYMKKLDEESRWFFNVFQCLKDHHWKIEMKN